MEKIREGWEGKRAGAASGTDVFIRRTIPAGEGCGGRRWVPSGRVRGTGADTKDLTRLRRPGSPDSSGTLSFPVWGTAAIWNYRGHGFAAGRRMEASPRRWSCRWGIRTGSQDLPGNSSRTSLWRGSRTPCIENERETASQGERATGEQDGVPDVRGLRSWRRRARDKKQTPTKVLRGRAGQPIPRFL